MNAHRMAVRALGLIVVAAIVAGWAAAGTPDLKSYFATDFKDQAYQRKVHTKVAQSWARPAESPKEGSKAVVIATILRDGSLLEARLHHRSGLEAWDAAATQAVRKAAPLDPLPKGYKGTSLEVHFHFEFN